jgi:hypothetical protein
VLLPNLTVDDLKQLPLQAQVAFAARCARRVQNLAQLPEGHPGRERLQNAVEAALAAAEAYASGSTAPLADSVVEEVDASRVVAGAPRVAEAAATAASEAARAASSAWQLTRAQTPEKDLPWELKSVEARKFRHAVADVSVELTALMAFTAAMEAIDAVGYQNEEFVAAVLNDYNRLLGLKLGSPRGPLGPW